MAVVGITGIVAVLAVSMGTEAYERQRFLKTVREVYHGLSLARTAAVTHGRPGCVAFENTRLTAFLDRSDPANHVYDSGTDDLLLQHVYGLTTNANASFPNAPSTSTPTAIFNARGFSVTSVGAYQGGTVTITDSTISDGTRKVETTVGGAARITK
jgi:Tfp pilus assembly protein FimT